MFLSRSGPGGSPAVYVMVVSVSIGTKKGPLILGNFIAVDR